ncbi:hypothetical protein HYZ97_01725 [Candidatus Pacearchaeota archaeon]|nr:hypothetical protein [Candidatus Pacearchaeota archaeon]
MYAIGCICLFLGLLWMFLPHASHAAFIESVGGHADAEEILKEHLIHTGEGLVLTLIGLWLLVCNERRQKQKKRKS